MNEPHDVVPTMLGPVKPHVVVLFGATGDLARRKLLPGLLHLAQAGLLERFEVLGVSLDDYDDEGFRAFAHDAVTEFSRRPRSDATWVASGARLHHVGQGGSPRHPRLPVRQRPLRTHLEP